MTVPLTVRWGIALAFVTAALSGVAVFLNGLVVRDFPDQTLLAAVRNGLVGAAFLALLLASRRGGELRGLPRRRRLGLLALGVIGGGIPFALFFTGLAQAGAPGAAVIQKTLFVWVALLAVPLLHERLGLAQLLGIAVLLGGTLVVTPPGSLGAGPGAAMILLATLFWAGEVVVARRLLGDVQVLPAAASRMLIGGGVLFAIVAVNGHLGGLAAWTLGQWAFVALTGAILLGYVAAWYGALRRAPASVVSSVLVAGAVVTGALQALASGRLPDPAKAGGLALLVAGALLVAVAAGGQLLRRATPAAAPAPERGERAP